MSGVYIRGMEIPEKPILFCIHPDGKVFSDMEGGWKEYRAIPVPDHGRLIDADALEAHGDCLSRLHVDFDAPAGHQVWRECVPFDDIPTIIPVDKEEER